MHLCCIYKDFAHACPCLLAHGVYLRIPTSSSSFPGESWPSSLGAFCMDKERGQVGGGNVVHEHICKFNNHRSERVEDIHMHMDLYIGSNGYIEVNIYVCIKLNGMDGFHKDSGPYSSNLFRASINCSNRFFWASNAKSTPVPRLLNQQKIKCMDMRYCSLHSQFR